jgi:DedD protein
VAESPAAGKPAQPRAAKAPGAEVKAPAGDLPTPRFTVQVGSYRDRAAAEEQAKKIRGRNVPAQVVPVPVAGRTWFRVQVNSFETRAEAEAYYRKKLLPQNVQGFVTNR